MAEDNREERELSSLVHAIMVQVMGEENVIQEKEKVGDKQPQPNDEHLFSRQVDRYKVICVNSPAQFYMLREEEFFAKGEQNKAIRKFQKHFRYLKQDGLLGVEELKVKTPIKDTLYGYYCKETKKWHRVRVGDFSKKWGMALILYVDHLLKMARVPLTSLKRLPADIANAPIMTVYRCHLADVMPINGGYNWGAEACQWFKTVLDHKPTWLALQMTYQRKDFFGGPDQIIDVGVVLLEIFQKHVESVNYRLVDTGYFGKAILIGGNPSRIPYVKELMPDFSIEEETALSFSFEPDFDGSIPKAAAIPMGQINLACVVAPDTIYVHNFCKVPELKLMEYMLETIIREKGIKRLRGLQDLEKQFFPVVCTILDENMELEYNRAEVDKDNVEVLLVDYGYKFQSRTSHLLPMPEEFQTIPSFAHRLHLKTVKPAYAHGLTGWSRDFLRKFGRKMLKLDKDLKPSYFAFRSDALYLEDTILIKDLKQEIKFEAKAERWVADPIEVSAQQASLYDKMIRNPLMAAHLVSYGAELVMIAREDEGKGHAPWDLSYLVDHFLGEGEMYGIEYVERVQDRLNKDEYFRGLLRRYEMDQEEE